MNPEILKRSFTPETLDFYMRTLVNSPPYNDNEGTGVRSMISIIHKDDDRETPELFQIYKNSDGSYEYVHYEGNTFRILDQRIIDPSTFDLNLPSNYLIEMYYGDTLIDPALLYYIVTDENGNQRPVLQTL